MNFTSRPSSAGTERPTAFATRLLSLSSYGSSGGTSLIKQSVLAACRRYKAQNHIRGFLDGEFAGDVFSAECLAFPDSSQIPPPYRRSPNPGIVFIAV